MFTANRALLHAWLTTGRAQRNVKRGLRPYGSHEEVIREIVPGRSFADVGAMWNVHGRNAFIAEDAGATKVTGVDVMNPTDTFKAEHARRESRVRMVTGDLHDPEVQAQTGQHDVVLCAGVFYHTPNPMHTLDCLRSLTRERLVLAGATVPEVPGLKQACVFYPGLPESQRTTFDRIFEKVSPGDRAGLTDEFDLHMGYAAWWWGITPSALRAMCEASGLAVERTWTTGFHTRVVTRRLD